MNRVHKQILQRHSCTLTTSLTVDEKFIERCGEMDLITPAMKSSIMAGENDSQKASKLLSYLPGRGPDAFNAFIIVLNERGEKWLASKLTDAYDIAMARGEMSPEKKAKLKELRQELMAITLDEIWDGVNHIFSPTEEVQIKIQDEEKQIEKLLDVLSSKSDLAFDHLVKALQKLPHYGMLAGRKVSGMQKESPGYDRTEIPGSLQTTENHPCARSCSQAIRLLKRMKRLRTSEAKRKRWRRKRTIRLIVKKVFSQITKKIKQINWKETDGGKSSKQQNVVT